jgi:molybdopterin molybdotransferase
MNIRRQPGCADNFEADLLPASTALEKILAAVKPVPGEEIVPVRAALGRVTAFDTLADIDVPSHTNSAVDGYALSGNDLPASGIRKFSITGTAWAGKPFEGPVSAGCCVRIMTGAMMPADTDTVIMQEHVEAEGDTARIGADHRIGENVRKAGEDIAQGQTAVPAGKLITPAELGLLASAGLAEVAVRPKLKVAFFSTGDELRSVGEPIEEGEIYDSNRYTLYGMLDRLGVEILDMGVVRDDPAILKTAFRQAAHAADTVITTGGVSVGKADHIKQILDEMGQVGFWKIAIKPGRPLAFGSVLDTLFFGLPGNPVAVMVTFYQFVRPALLHMMGLLDVTPVRLRVECGSDLKKKPGRTEFIRARVGPRTDGTMIVEKTGAQGSGILSSMSLANCFIVLRPDCTGVNAGELVDVELFHGLV